VGLVVFLLFSHPAWLPTPLTFAWEYGEHKELGDEAFRAVTGRLVRDGYYSSTQGLKNFLKSSLRMTCVEQERTFYFEELSHLPNEATYGTLNGLSGDHSENPLLLEDGLQDRTSAINQTIALHVEYFEKFRNGAPNLELFGLDFWYGLLAYVNLSHFYNYGRSFEAHLEDFDPGHVKKLWQPKHVNEVFKEINTHLIDKYLTLHAFAITLAERAGGEYWRGNLESGSRYLYYAILFNAFADHFLEDMFASGHLVVKRTIASTLINNRKLHDFYNQVGVSVANVRGQVWKTYGDNNLNRPEGGWKDADGYLALHPPEGQSCPGDFVVERSDNVTVMHCRAVQAVAQSLWEVWTAFERTRKGDTSSIMDHMPEKKAGRMVEELKRFPGLSMAPVAEEKDNRAIQIFKLFPVMTMVPVPFGTTDLKSLDVPEEEIPRLQKVTQLIPNRDFVRTRVANSITFLWGRNFAENKSMNLGARLGLGGWLYSYQDLEDKTGSVDHWLGWTVSYIGGLANAKKENPGFHRIKLGPQYNMDIWVTKKRYLGIYSYVESGVDIRDGASHFLFAPSIGLQIGPLIGWDNYVLPDWLRIPLQIILPVKGCVTYNVAAGEKPEPSFAIEVDLLF
jgi:hypothetical protein